MANLADAHANVHRLKQLEGFKKVYAPFSGVITRRNVDPGALINAGAGAAGRELFDLARVDPLRVFASMPQAYAPAPGPAPRRPSPSRNSPARFSRPGGPHRGGHRPRHPHAPDRGGHPQQGRAAPAGLPGGSALHGGTGRAGHHPREPMLFRAEGPSVAVVGDDGRVALRPIAIGRDYGTSLEILSGVSPADRIVVNPSDSLEDGQQVRVEQTAKP